MASSIELADLLREAAKRLRALGAPQEVAPEFERVAGGLEQLALQVHEPCLVAVVGKMKAGKSTFINALLGEDLAKVGVTETTATINYMRYGPLNRERPVRCVWREGGRVTEEPPEFLQRLQGRDVETLRRAKDILRLEYHLPNPLLERLTLVDTPGTSAAVDEHQNRTAEFLALAGQLRERNNESTDSLARSADAVIYLIGEVARTSDLAFLQEFQEVTGGRSSALSAIGVMSKIDLQEAVMARRHELSAKIARQLRDGLNTVLPVSAGMKRALDRLSADDCRPLAELIESVRHIPQKTLEKLLDNEEFYLNLEPADCPVGVAEREALLGETPWTVFTTIARAARDERKSSEEVRLELEELAGFLPLEQLLERHFVQRGVFLRHFRICQDARRLLQSVYYRLLPLMEARQEQELARRERMLAFVDAAEGEPAVAAELRELIAAHTTAHRGRDSLKEWTGEWQTLAARLAGLFHRLQEDNADFEALQKVYDHAGRFSEAELEELRALFGLHGLETASRLPQGGANIDHVAERQRTWSVPFLDPIRRLVSQRAVIRYGMLLEELDAPEK